MLVNPVSPGRPAEDYISKGGRPAQALEYDGMPSFETENGGLVIFQTLLCMRSHPLHGSYLFPKNYTNVCAEFPDGFNALFPGGKRQWRPLIYQQEYSGPLMFRFGSQMELRWREGIYQVRAEEAYRTPVTVFDAEDKAMDLLLEFLSPQQRLELASQKTKFRVRGAATKNLYEVELDNGFAILDKNTCEVVVSYCLHTEHWLPAADQALTIKLALEDPELEIECLENANPSRWPRKPTRRPTRVGHELAAMERELII